MALPGLPHSPSLSDIQLKTAQRPPHLHRACECSSAHLERFSTNAYLVENCQADTPAEPAGAARRETHLPTTEDKEYPDSEIVCL